MIPLNCPKCSLPLNQAESHLDCSCGSSFPIVDGIPILTQSEKYYGEISQARKRELLDHMDQGRYWRSLVWEAFGTSYSFLHHIITDEARNDFRYALPHNPDGVVLDLGAGWGTMSTHFARDYRLVVALDGTLDRCQFIQKRCRQDRIDNVECVAASILECPLPERFFDIVLMNGVLEWIGESSLTGDPRELQMDALRTVRKLLKPEGVLYIGIENSHGFKYLLGEPDDHSGLPHITYLTRPKANEKALKELKRPYRTYTYNRKGYRSLLEESGFPQTEFYYPVPDYKSVNALVPLDRDNLLAYYNSDVKLASHPNSVVERVRSLEIAALEQGHAGDYAASYSIVAGSPNQPSMMKAVADYALSRGSALLKPEPERVEVLQLSSASGKKFERGRVKFLLFADKNPRPSLVASFSRACEYDRSLRKEASLFRLPVWKDCEKILVPTVAAYDSILGRPVLFREAWPGKTMQSRLSQSRYSETYSTQRLEEVVREDFRIAGECLRELHTRTVRQGSRSAEAFIAGLFEKAETTWESGLFPNLERLRAVISEYYSASEDCILHGDFTPSNLIIMGDEDSGSRVGLIDWELSESNGLTILDYARFIYYYIIQLEELQTGLPGGREELLTEIFIKGESWLSRAVMDFFAGATPGGTGDSALETSLMQFALLFDALLQCDHSAHPPLKLGRNFARIYNLFEALRPSCPVQVTGGLEQRA